MAVFWPVESISRVKFVAIHLAPVDKSEEISAKTARVVDPLAANHLGGVLISSQPLLASRALALE